MRRSMYTTLFFVGLSADNDDDDTNNDDNEDDKTTMTKKMKDEGIAATWALIFACEGSVTTARASQMSWRLWRAEFPFGSDELSVCLDV